MTAVSAPYIRVSDITVRKKYVPGSIKGLPTRHIGQRKLLNTVIELLTTYGHKSKTVVYAGSAPGNNFVYVAKLFPDHEYHFVDPAPFAASIKGYKNLHLYNEYFTDELAKKWAGKDVIFISDIRGHTLDESEKERQNDVAENNAMQERWVKIMRPIVSMLKFRFPFNVTDPVKMMPGEFYIQSWPGMGSTETRLIVEQKDIDKIVECDPIEYEEKMFHHNMVGRPHTEFKIPPEFKEVKTYRINNYDSARELWIYHEYMTKFKADPKELIKIIESQPMYDERIHMRRAFATIVFGSADYIKGAVALGHSLRLVGTGADTICMITPDIKETTDLKKAFTEVITVDYIERKMGPMKSEAQNKIYSPWITKCLTKFHILDMTDYDSVCFLDSDMVATQNIDLVFKLQTPAGSFTNVWLETDTRQRNPYYGKKTGDTITWQTVKGALERSFVLCGGMFVIRPEKGKLKKFLTALPDPVAIGRGVSANDEKAIAYYESVVCKRNWKQIGHPYNFIPWHMKKISNILGGTPIIPNVIHYVMPRKPWNSEPEKLTEWPDLAVWKEIYDDFYGRKPTTKMCPMCLMLNQIYGSKRDTGHLMIKDSKFVCPSITK